MTATAALTMAVAAMTSGTGNDHVKWSDLVECWHSHKTYQEQVVTGLNSNWLVTGTPEIPKEMG